MHVIDSSSIDYSKFLKGHYKKQHVHFLSGLSMFQGASLASNVFQAPNLEPSGNVIRDLLELVKAGRKQNFANLKIWNLENYIAELKEVIEQIKELQNVELSFDLPENEGLVMKISYPELLRIMKETQPLRARTELHPEWIPKNKIDVMENKLMPKTRSIEEKQRLLSEISSNFRTIFTVEDVAF